MAVASLSSSTYDKLFLEYITPGLEQEWYNNTVLYGRFGTDRDSMVTGKYAVMKVNYSSPKSFRPAGSTTYPTAKQGLFSEFQVYMKRIYGTLQFDNLALALGKGQGITKELLKTETEAMAKGYIPNKMNKVYWGDGSGRLAITYALVNDSVTLYVDGDSTNWGLFGIDSNVYTRPSKYLFEGMSVNIYDSSGTLEEEEVDISTITYGTGATDTLTMSRKITCSANAFLFDPDTYAAAEAAGTGVPMGLAGIVSSANPYIGITASSAFQGVNRDTYTWAQGQVFNMGTAITTPAVVTETKILEVIQKCERWGNISVIITNDTIWRVLFEIFKADKTMPNDPGLWGGLTGFKFYGGKKNAIPVIADEDCPDGRMYFLDDSTIKILAPASNGFEWIPGATNHILTDVSGKDEWVAHIRHYYNMSIKRPQANGLLRYIKHSST